MENEKLHRKLIERCKDYIAQYIAEKVPEKGRINPHTVSFSWAGTNYKGVFIIETDLLSKDYSGRLIRTGMHEYGDDRLVSHYYYRGTNEELINIMKDPANTGELIAEFESLERSVDNLD